MTKEEIDPIQAEIKRLQGQLGVEQARTDGFRDLAKSYADTANNALLLVKELSLFEKYDSAGRCVICSVGTQGLPLSLHDDNCLIRRAYALVRQPAKMEGA